MCSVQSEPSGRRLDEEPEVVEDDELAERERAVDGAADRDGEDRVGAEVAQRRDVRAVVDLARETSVAVAVAADVQQLAVRERAARDLRGPVLGLDVLRRFGACRGRRSRSR